MSDYSGKEYIGLKVLGIIILLSGIISIFGGIAYISVGSAVEEEAENSIIGIIALFPVAVTVMAMGAVMVVFGFIFVYLGYKLYKHSKFAYWVTFVLTVLGIISSLIYFQILTLAIGIVIAWYLYTIRGSFISGFDWRLNRS